MLAGSQDFQLEILNCAYQDGRIVATKSVRPQVEFRACNASKRAGPLLGRIMAFAGRNSHELLADIRPRKHADKRVRCILNPFRNCLPVFDFPS